MDWDKASDLAMGPFGALFLACGLLVAVWVFSTRYIIPLLSGYVKGQQDFQKGIIEEHHDAAEKTTEALHGTTTALVKVSERLEAMSERCDDKLRTGTGG